MIMDKFRKLFDQKLHDLFKTLPPESINHSVIMGVFYAAQREYEEELRQKIHKILKVGRYRE
jgi:hypothetical protein